MFHNLVVLATIVVGFSQLDDDHLNLLQLDVRKRFLVKDPVAYEVCNSAPKLDLHNIKYNNLGGKCGLVDGCVGQPQELRFEGVTTVGGNSVDMVVTNSSDYDPANSLHNGVKPPSLHWGQVNMRCGTATDFNVQFVNSANDSPVTMDQFAFSVYDVDSGKKSQAREKVVACGNVVTLTSESPKSELFHSKAVGGCNSFSSTSRGRAKDNPTDPDNLTDKQLRRLVMFGYQGISSFQIRFEISSCNGGWGKSALFAASPAAGVCGQVTTTTTTSTTLGSQTVTVEFDTLGVADADSDGKFYIKFGNENVWYGPLDNPNVNDFEKNQVSSFILTDVDKDADLENIALKAEDDDGWGVESVKVNGLVFPVQTGFWLDDPCTEVSYAGRPCHQEVRLSHKPKSATVVFHSLDVKWAGSDGEFFIRFGNDVTEYGPLDNPNVNDFERNQDTTITINNIYAKADLTTLALRSNTGDGWGVESIKVNGVPLNTGNGFWMDDHDGEYKGRPVYKKHIFTSH